MICPHCKKEIADSAIRCRHCRKTLFQKNNSSAPILFKNFYETIFQTFSRWNRIGEKTENPSWGLWEVAALWGAVFLGSLAIEHYEIALHFLETLRAHFFILTKEPLLQTYVYIAIDTFVLKAGVVGLIAFSFLFRKETFLDAMGLKNKTYFFENPIVWPYLIYTIIVAFVEGMDPLFPYFPTNLFFKQAAWIGNTEALLSLLIVAPVAEEIFFRGFMYPVFRKKMGANLAILFTAALFTLAHFPQMKHHADLLVWIFVGGIFMTAARAVTGSTLNAIFLHALYNALLTAAGLVKCWLEIR